jgi:hypothetical protein
LPLPLLMFAPSSRREVVCWCRCSFGFLWRRCFCGGDVLDTLVLVCDCWAPLVFAELVLSLTVSASSSAAGALALLR